MSEILDWFGMPITVPEKPAKTDKGVNPCLAVYGTGPEGQKCKGCTLIAAIGVSKNYYKCRLRKLTHSASSDHKLRWPACGKFEQREAGEDIPLYDL